MGQISFTPPDDWAPSDAAGQTRYWVRLRTQAAATTIAKFDLLEPVYDYSSYYGAGWFIDENTQRLNFQIGDNSFLPANGLPEPPARPWLRSRALRLLRRPV